MRIEPLKVLSPDGESLLRMRALAHPRDIEASLQNMRSALEAGKLYVACLYDDYNLPRGIAAWRWHDSRHSYAQIIVLYTQPVTPPELGEELVRYVFSSMAEVPTLNVIETRMRDDSPGVREAWTRRGVIFFERCRMTRSLPQTLIPLLPVPKNYHLTTWEDEHQAQAEQIAATAYGGTIDAVVVPDTQPSRIVKSLRRLRNGEFAGVDGWNKDASLVVLDKREQVVGYIAVALGGGGALIADIAVHESHLRRGLARLMLTRSMTACFKQGVPSISFAVTTRNPIRNLCNQLGFQAVDCGEVGLWWRDGRQAEWK
jgi:GNAT superfamily N-acetyltransferase